MLATYQKLREWGLLVGDRSAVEQPTVLDYRRRVIDAKRRQPSAIPGLLPAMPGPARPEPDSRIEAMFHTARNRPESSPICPGL